MDEVAEAYANYLNRNWGNRKPKYRIFHRSHAYAGITIVPMDHIAKSLAKLNDCGKTGFYAGITFDNFDQKSFQSFRR